VKVTSSRKEYTMRKFWLFVPVALTLSGCSTQEARSPNQAKTEADFYDCARTEGVRGASITSIVDTPNSGVNFRARIDGDTAASGQMRSLLTCMRAKGYRVN
jgi:uncharacterized protein YceK